MDYVIPGVDIQIQTARVKNRNSPGQIRVVMTVLKKGEPYSIFLVSVLPPDSYTKRMREGLMTICSVDDLAEYPVGVSAIAEVNAADYAIGTYVYAAYENKVYICEEGDNGEHVWAPYITYGTSELQPLVYTHTLPFFRKNKIDVILPNRHILTQFLDETKKAIFNLERDIRELEDLETL